MSSIITTGSSLNSDTLPAAFLEAALFLDAGEKLRNGANPGITPKSFVTASFSADEGVVTIAASLPVDVTVSADGAVSYTAKDYLGGTYAAFTAGGAVTATTRMAALVQVAQLLSAAEKAVQPVEDQPNFLQLESSSESGTISINAALPVSSSIDANGNVLFTAIDYL
jgi:hypothetical protein